MRLVIDNNQCTDCTFAVVVDGVTVYQSDSFSSVLDVKSAIDNAKLAAEPVAWMTECINGESIGVVEQSDGPGSTTNHKYWTPDFPVYRHPAPAPAFDEAAERASWEAYADENLPNAGLGTLLCSWNAWLTCARSKAGVL